MEPQRAPTPRTVPSEPDAGRRVYRHSPVLTAAFILPLLTGCQHAVPASFPANAQTAPGSTGAEPVRASVFRAIVRFRQAVAYQDEAFLNDLSQRVGARLTYVASVSATTHVYRVELPRGQRPADVLARLAAQPIVLSVKQDALARPSR